MPSWRAIAAGPSLSSLRRRRTSLYLLRAMQRSPKTGWTGLISFNDRCRDFGELHEVILQARKLAAADIEKDQCDASAARGRVTFPRFLAHGGHNGSPRC
jgi:hypothetical protein